jgi:hypothetical protein
MVAQLVTLFTIIFMTTIATLVKRFALWKAQEGATIAELEQYQASISLPSTIKMIVLLRAFTLASFGLVFVWSWYYLGSQAVSREYTFQLSSKKTHTQLIFPNAEVPSAFENATALPSVQLSDLNSYFVNAQGNAGSSNGHQSVIGTDLKGNAILPILNTTAPNNDKWCNTRANNENVFQTCMISYASSLGVPVFSSDASSSSSSGWLGTYELSTSYIYTNCQKPIIGSHSDFPAGTLSTLSTSFNVTNHTSNGFPQVAIWSRVSNSSIRTTCNLERHYVDAKADCDASACIFNSARLTPGKSVAPATQFLDAGFSKRFFDSLLVVNGFPDGGDDPSYVEGLGATYQDGSWGISSEDDFEFAALQFSWEMTGLVNTYMASSQARLGYFSSPVANLNSSAIDASGYFTKSPLNVNYPQAKAHGANYNPQYILSFPWITVDILTCSILFFAAAASFWLRIQTVAPDIFGYVSSMTRDNPHMGLPDGGSTMSGSDRARALKHVRVKIAHLNGDSGVGHIGLAATRHDLEMGRLEKKRHYM